jgi:hypothetical protein
VVKLPPKTPLVLRLSLQITTFHLFLIKVQIRIKLRYARALAKVMRIASIAQITASNVNSVRAVISEYVLLMAPVLQLAKVMRIVRIVQVALHVNSALVVSGSVSQIQHNVRQLANQIRIAPIALITALPANSAL